MIGQTISHYKILEKLGEGGMGVVYKAHDTKLDRLVALKFLPQQITVSEEDKARFLQEARAASAVMHPNVCVIYDIAEHDKQQFIVMEYVDGKTLRQIVPVEKTQMAIDYAIQIGEALQEAHSKGIVHRDIKTDNIMVNTKNQIKVMDFGLAKLKGSLKLTKTSSTVGTLAYMAPEQIQGGAVDARSDIFSFGVVLYEMLTGHMPFRGEHEAAMVYSIVNEEPTPIQKYLPDISSELVHILNRALEKDPENRYQFVHEMVIDLRRLRKETSRVSRIPATEAAQFSQPASKKRGRTVMWVGIGAAAVLATAIAGYFLFRSTVSEVEATGAASNTLAVMYFENIPDPEDKEHIGEMLTSLMITSLSQTRGLEVISRERLFDIQNELNQGGSKRIAASLVSKIAQRSGAATMLTGTVIQTQPQLAVTTQLVEVKSGKILGSQRVTGFQRARIFRWWTASHHWSETI
jgi:serine/threonine protein kinase